MIIIFYNATSGDIVRFGQDPNPQINVKPGEDWIPASLTGDPFRYRVDVATKQLILLEETPATRTWEDVRISRDRLLQASDFTQLADAPLTDLQKEEAVIYRQTLRDITSMYESAADVIFPDKPSFIP